MNRREMMLSAPAAALLPAPGDAAPTMTPIMALFHKHRAIIAAANAHEPTCTEREVDAEMERLFYVHSDKVEAEMMALPCSCAGDFAAKAIIETVQGRVYPDWQTSEFWREARALIADNDGAAFDPTSQKAQPKDLHPVWLADWRQAGASLEMTEDDTPEEDAIWNRREELALKLANTPATSKKGLSAQFEWFKEDVGQYVEEMVRGDYSEVFNVIRSGIERAA